MTPTATSPPSTATPARTPSTSGPTAGRTATAGGGDDHLRGGRGFSAFSVNLNGDADNDLVVGWSSANDKLTGGAGNDQLFSTFGDGTSDGGAGNDVIVNLGLRARTWTALGGNGADTIVGTPDGTDVVDAGAGNDVVEVSGSTTRTSPRRRTR